MKILLLEDEPGDAYLAKQLLSENGFQFILTSTLEEAISAFGESPFDLVLLDLGLPDSHGIQTFTDFRSAWPSAAVLVWTGLEDKNLGSELIRLGARGYIVKTFLTFSSGKELGELCRKALRSKPTIIC